MLKNLGDTHINISPIGMGTGFTEDELKNEKEVTNLLLLGFDFGINFIDTSENYCGGLTEKIVGKAIRGRRDRVIVATKFSPEHSLSKQLTNACDGSLKRLNTDYIDLYQFHWPNPKIPLEETALGLKKLLTLGKIRFIGVGNFSKKELVIIQHILGKTKVVSLQTEYNLYERTIEQNGILSYCNKNEVSIIAYSPLDQGRFKILNNKQTNLIKKLAKKYDKTEAQIILRWLVNQKPIIVIPKTTSKKHLKENSQSLNFDLSKENIKEIDDFFPIKLQYIPTREINVSSEGERGRQVYQTLQEAIENKLGYSPDPLELAETLKQGDYIKPVRLIRSSKGSKKYQYDLINGRIRYWAWVIAFGNNKPIPAYIREDL